MQIKYTGEATITIASFPWSQGDVHEIPDAQAETMIARGDFEAVDATDAQAAYDVEDILAGPPEETAAPKAKKDGGS